MNNLNSVLVEGNLTRDPELKYTSKGTAVCNFSLAVNRYTKDAGGEGQKECSFFEVVCWARLAEVTGEYLKKGRGVRVVGRLKQDRWQTQDGSNRSKVVIVAEHVEFKPQLKKPEGQAEAAEAVNDETPAEDSPTSDEDISF